TFWDYQQNPGSTKTLLQRKSRSVVLHALETRSPAVCLALLERKDIIFHSAPESSTTVSNRGTSWNPPWQAGARDHFQLALRNQPEEVALLLLDRILEQPQAIEEMGDASTEIKSEWTAIIKQKKYSKVKVKVELVLGKAVAKRERTNKIKGNGAQLNENEARLSFGSTTESRAAIKRPK
ncbi:unnamed protein product, partial [Amoebophrya sp. A25]